ncbi:hypothetical protein [Escherichia phage vB_EcoD_SU57]|uniref:Uncharacterized protein n=1 Tax=Escherichia phage vB_EcoD_SU57 TaxID=2743969 RepID=A0A7D5K7Z0_9CAUD|nr:hypothetical protein [Escherichia phage vB_EcoD_SU57]
MINERPFVVTFKPRNKPRMEIDEYLLKYGNSYFVLEISAYSDRYIVRNDAGMVVSVSKLDVEIVR